MIKVALKVLAVFVAGGSLAVLVAFTAAKFSRPDVEPPQYVIVQIDGCEYIKSRWHSDVLIHKANCPNH